MDSGIQEIKDLFYRDRLPEAYKRLRDLESQFGSSSEFQSLISNCEEISILREDLREADRCLEHLADLDSWTLVKEIDNLAIFSKKSDQDFIVRAELLLETPVFPVLTVCNEIDLLPEWIQVVKSVRTVATISHFRRLLWYKFNIPWPASNRDMMVNAYGITLPENNSIMILLRGVESEKFLNLDIPPPDGADVRITMKTGVLNIMKRSHSQTQISFIVHSDPHVAMVPESLLNYCTQTGIFYFMKSMQEKSMDFVGSVFEKRVEERKEFYDELGAVIHEFLGDN